MYLGLINLRKQNKGQIPSNSGKTLVVNKESTSLDDNSIFDIIKNWNRFSADKDMSFNECMNYVQTYLKNNKNINEASIESYISKNALIYLSDINRVKSSINEHFAEFPNVKNTLLEVANDISICDRIINNNQKLNKINYSDIFNKYKDIDSMIYESCLFIDNNTKASQSVKYNLALENTLYNLSMIGKKNEYNTVFESVTNYFFLKENDDLTIDKLQDVFIESPLYKDIDKSNVIYAIEMSRKDLSDSDFGIPQQRKYPMPDKRHVFSAIKFFNYVDPEYEKELAENIKRKAKEYGITLSVGKTNKLKKYLKKVDEDSINESIQESVSKCPFCEETIGINEIESHIKHKHPKELKKYPHYIKSKIDSIKKKATGLIKESDYTSVCPYCNEDIPAEQLSEHIRLKHPEANQDNYTTESFKGINNDIYVEANNIINKFKKNPIKDIISSFKTKKKKDKKWCTELVNKIFTQSPEAIVDGIPDFIGVIRLLSCLALLSIPGWGGIAITCIGVFTNKLIEINLRKESLDKAIKKYKKEKEKTDKEMYATNNEKRKKRLSELSKKLDDDIFKLEQAGEKVFTQKELDDRIMNDECMLYKGSSITIDNPGGIPKPDPTDLGDFLNHRKYTFVQELYRTLNIFQTVMSDSKEFSNYYDKGILQMVDPKEIEKYQWISNIKDLSKYIDYDRMEVKIAYFLPLLITNSTSLSSDQNIKLRDSMMDLCDKVNEAIPAEYTLYIDGTDDLYYFIFQYNVPIYMPNHKKYERINVDMQLDALDSLNTSIDNFFDNKLKDKVNESFSYAINKDNIDDVLSLLKESNDILGKDNIRKELNHYIESNHALNADNIIINSKINRFLESLNSLKSDEFRNTILLADKYSNINEGFDALLELSVGSNTKLAANKLKNTVQRLNDKQRRLSKNLDDSLEKMDDELRKESSNRRREQIIKGRVLPKASKIIKLGIGSGVASLINPALGAITVLGTLGVSKIGSKKEKQYILDEIDIQLKIVDKKIQLAENNNDMKSLEELFKIQKKLRRERQRIFYNMKAYYPVSSN